MRFIFGIILMAILVSFGGFSQKNKFSNENLTPIETLGREIFFDYSLSEPAGMSCATCHDPNKFFQNTRELTLADGSKKFFTGAREIPSLSYAAWSYSPMREIVDDEFFEDEIVKQGGFFADGHAGSLREQILGPLFSPIEMANKTPEMVVEKLKKASYRPFFEEIFGKNIFEKNADSVIWKMGLALESFQKSKFVNPFSSKFDRWQAGLADFTEQELKGLVVFTSKGRCRNCHVSRWHATDEPKVIFSKFIYENIGTPRVEKYPFFYDFTNNLGENWRDEGLFLTTQDSLDRGKIKVPTVRNAAKTAPYMHNGALKTLEEVVHFYNKPEDFPPAEIAENVNRIEVGDLNLTAEEEAALVAFLKTLTDEN
jgi:cytochrome c peroxidase